MLLTLLTTAALASPSSSAPATPPSTTTTAPPHPLQGVDATGTGGDVDGDDDSVTSPQDLILDAGLGRGVSVKAEDGSFEFQARARIQLRAQATADDDADVDEAGLRPEFFVRRARLVFGGRVLRDLFQWQVQLGLSQNDVEPDLPVVVRDAYITWNAPLDLGVRVGQMKVPFDRQRLTSSSAQQFTERSRMVNELNLDRDIGVQLIHTGLVDDKLAVQLGVFGGDGRNRPTPTPTLLSVARVQLQPFGAFDDLVEGDLGRTPSPKLAIALAGAFNADSTRVRSTHGTQLIEPRDADGDGTTEVGVGIDYAHATADVLFKWRGLSAFASGIARVATDDGDSNDDEAAIARSAAGVVAQVGYLVVDGLELAARGAVTVPLDPAAWGGPDNAIDLDERGAEWEATVGSTFAFAGHNLKLQLDGGLVGDDSERPDVVARSQLQLYF